MDKVNGGRSTEFSGILEKVFFGMKKQRIYLRRVCMVSVGNIWAPMVLGFSRKLGRFRPLRESRLGGAGMGSGGGGMSRSAELIEEWCDWRQAGIGGGVFRFFTSSSSVDTGWKKLMFSKASKKIFKAFYFFKV